MMHGTGNVLSLAQGSSHHLHGRLVRRALLYFSPLRLSCEAQGQPLHGRRVHDDGEKTSLYHYVPRNDVDTPLRVPVNFAKPCGFDGAMVSLQDRRRLRPGRLPSLRGQDLQTLLPREILALGESLPEDQRDPDDHADPHHLNGSLETAMIGVLLVNLGTPDAPTTGAVRKYLTEFLSDPRVIDIAAPLRWLLVHGIIAPFRSPKSAAAYRKIWTEQGSPLLVNTKKLGEEVQKRLGTGYAVAIAMRYGAPSIRSALQNLPAQGVDRLRIMPLYPQYASSSGGSTIEEVFRRLGPSWNLPHIEILSSFYDHPGFIRSFAEVGRPALESLKPDHVVFSFHGLPERHILKSDPAGGHCLKSASCCDRMSEDNRFCYRAQCFQTARLIAHALNIATEYYSVSFQSRLGRTPWIKPYTDLLVPELIRSGKKKIAVFCPAFVADCLETLEEIGIRLRNEAAALGAALELVPSLNHHPAWVETIASLVR